MPRKGYRKPACEARTIPVNVRLAPREKEHLLKCVEESDVTGVADFLRLLIMGFEIKRRPPQARVRMIDELATLNRKLASIDNNMNQLARMANSGARVSEIHLQHTLDSHRELKALAMHVLQQVAERR